MSYVVAIPSYQRSTEIVKKTLHLLLRGGTCPKDRVYIFVANTEEEEKYKQEIPVEYYKEIVVGEVGISKQRRFISMYFPEGRYIVSIDDDIEKLMQLYCGDMIKLCKVHQFFLEAYDVLMKNNASLWGIYPCSNSYFMNEHENRISTNLKFCIGHCFGYINSYDCLPCVELEAKEDYEISILHFKKKGCVIRFNDICAKTRKWAKGGLGKDRFEKYKTASEYLLKEYPEFVNIFYRKNGLSEIRFKRIK